MCSEDTGYNATYEKAAMVLHGEAKLPVDPCEVEESEHYDLEATRSFIGIARSDFQRVTGFSPAAVGLGEVDCPNELGQNFKGIIVVNPMRPWVEYNLTHRQRVGSRQLKLPRERVCREGQGSEALQREREKKENDKFFTKLRNCTLTMEHIESVIEKPDLLSKFVALAAGQPSGSGIGAAPAFASPHKSGAHGCQGLGPAGVPAKSPSGASPSPPPLPSPLRESRDPALLRGRPTSENLDAASVASSGSRPSGTGQGAAARKASPQGGFDLQASP